MTLSNKSIEVARIKCEAGLCSLTREAKHIFLKEAHDILEAYLAAERTQGRDFPQWQPIETAPKNEVILVHAPSKHGLPAMTCICQWNEDAGFCVDGLREVEYWLPIKLGRDWQAIEAELTIANARIAECETMLVKVRAHLDEGNRYYTSPFYEMVRDKLRNSIAAYFLNIPPP